MSRLIIGLSLFLATASFAATNEYTLDAGAAQIPSNVLNCTKAVITDNICVGGTFANNRCLDSTACTGGGGTCKDTTQYAEIQCGDDNPLDGVGNQCSVDIAPCVGDCDENGLVIQAEIDLITILEDTGGNASLAWPIGCPAADTDSNGLISMSELQESIFFQLNGCPVAQAACGPWLMPFVIPPDWAGGNFDFEVFGTIPGQCFGGSARDGLRCEGDIECTGGFCQQGGNPKECTFNAMILCYPNSADVIPITTTILRGEASISGTSATPLYAGTNVVGLALSPQNMLVGASCLHNGECEDIMCYVHMEIRDLFLGSPTNRAPYCDFRAIRLSYTTE